MSSVRIVYRPREDASAEAELSALVNIYRLVLDAANKKAPGVTSTSGPSVKCTEEVGDVERQPG